MYPHLWRDAVRDRGCDDVITAESATLSKKS